MLFHIIDIIKQWELRRNGPVNRHNRTALKDLVMEPHRNRLFLDKLKLVLIFWQQSHQKVTAGIDNIFLIKHKFAVYKTCL